MRVAPPPRRYLRRLLAIALIAGLALVLPILLLRWVPPPITAYMLQSPTTPVRYSWVPSTRISAAVPKAVLASEDQKFYQHHGFDLAAIETAIEHNRTHDTQRGASTISQQTAKNLFLWPGGGYLRKGLEAGLTVLIEALWPKSRILEVYLNIAEFGPGIYGVEAAAQTYFHKPAATLSRDEAARLAAVLPSPRRWSAREPGPYVRTRADWILRQMGHPRGIGDTESADTPLQDGDPEPLESDSAAADPRPGTEPPAGAALAQDVDGRPYIEADAPQPIPIPAAAEPIGGDSEY
ncbi:monofunctional biosynthetic peptidoglycan transglycosylase [Sinimarinibacterium sp. CAU 1509]|nr:monofunctional biosynthetic peptidoglycan transglycosylase [Sinimarinibacterium sp. CAU 1509]